jgi:hypothetical protein
MCNAAPDDAKPDRTSCASERENAQACELAQLTARLAKKDEVIRVVSYEHHDNVLFRISRPRLRTTGALAQGTGL